MSNIRKSAAISVASGSSNLRINISLIRKISLDNITRVRRYDLSNHEDFVIHTIEFMNGGTVVLGYNKAGKIMRFQVNGIRTRIDGDHITLLSQ
jgi:hypothetical protein